MIFIIVDITSMCTNLCQFRLIDSLHNFLAYYFFKLLLMRFNTIVSNVKDDFMFWWSYNHITPKLDAIEQLGAKNSSGNLAELGLPK